MVGFKNGISTLHGNLDGLFTQYATDLRSGWITEVADGISDPGRRMKQAIRTGSGKGPRLTHTAFFARYMDVRRNTLHGYYLDRLDTQEFVAIHDGSLPLQLP